MSTIDSKSNFSFRGPVTAQEPERRNSSPEVPLHKKEEGPRPRSAMEGGPTRRQRQRNRHTMDTTRGDIQEKRRGSLWLRVFRRKSHISTSASTSSQLSEDETMSILESPKSRRAAKQDGEVLSSTSPEEVPVSATKNNDNDLSRGLSGRRATMDLGHSSHSGRLTSTRIMEEDEYKAEQQKLASRAEDYAMCAQLEDAIAVWVQALQLAEEQQDTLTNKTEILCTLISLHIQAATSPPDDGAVESSERHKKFHRQIAKRYIPRIKPALVSKSWLNPTIELLDFFAETESWELALQIGEQLGDDQIEHSRIAMLNYEVAKLKLNCRRQGEALQHLQASLRALQKQSSECRDGKLYSEVLGMLAVEYSNQSQYALALEAYQEQLRYTIDDNERAQIICQTAMDVYIPMGKFDTALENLQQAGQIVGRTTKQEADMSQEKIHLQLMQTKVEVLFRLGKLEQALKTCQCVLDQIDPKTNPAEKAKTLYTMGRLCLRLRQTSKAISYFEQELAITQGALGNHLNVSIVMHELAKLYDEGMGDYSNALSKYQEALMIELKVLEECKTAMKVCPKCKTMANRGCPIHAQLQRDCTQQIRETKKCQGRIHFKRGDFNKALQTSIPQAGMPIPLYQ